MTEPRRHLAIYTSALGRGGAERAMLNLANELADKAIRTDLIIASREESDYLGLLESRVRLIDLDASPALRGFPRLVRYLRREKPTATLSFEPRGHAMLLSARGLVGHRIRCAASVQNFHSQEFDTDIGLSRRLVLRSLRHVLPRMDRIFAVASRVADDVVRNFGVPPSLVKVIYNPILSEKIDAMARQTVDHPWFGENAPPVVVSVGRLTRQKNYSLLLRALKVVRRTRDVRLVILGEGELREELGSTARALGLADAVSFPGFVENPFGYMARASVFALSSDWEGLPSVLIEALAVGCPIVSTDCPSGPREILQDGEYGRLVPTGDVGSLAAAIEATLTEKTKSSRLRERALDYSSDRIAEEYIRELFGDHDLA